jgi:hypothetical protein
MKTPPENEFRELRRLLALKRYEQPPPGYFNSLPREILSELKAERYPPSQPADVQGSRGWLAQLWDRLQAQPSFAGACAALLGAALIGGVVLGGSGGGNSGDPAEMPSLLTEVGPVPTTDATAIVGSTPSVFQPVTFDSTLLMASNNLEGRPSLFDSGAFIDPVTVDYR